MARDGPSTIEHKVKACPNCQQHQNTPATAPLHPWEWPKQPWERVHVNYAERKK